MPWWWNKSASLEDKSHPYWVQRRSMDRILFIGIFSASYTVTHSCLILYYWSDQFQNCTPTFLACWRHIIVTKIHDDVWCGTRFLRSPRLRILNHETSWNSLNSCWWLVELPYLFKAGFCLKFWEMSITQYAKDDFTRLPRVNSHEVRLNETPMWNSPLLDVFWWSKQGHLQVNES